MTKQFFKYRKQWIEETQILSTGGFDHPALVKIIEMGDEVLPLIFYDLSHSTALFNPIHWFYALSKITGESPVRDEHLGDITEMALDWLEWGQLNGYSDCIDLNIKK